MTALRLPILWLAGLLGLAGCSVNQPVSLYQLDSGTPAQPAQSAGMAVLLGPVLIADYLQRETLLQRQPDGSLQAAADGRWAGSLSSDIDQLLLRQVAGHLDSQRVVLAPATQGFTPDVQVLLSITRLDSGKSQPAVLDAQWRLIDRAPARAACRYYGGTGPGPGRAPATSGRAVVCVAQTLGQPASYRRSAAQGRTCPGQAGRKGQGQDPHGLADSYGHGSVQVLIAGPHTRQSPH